MKEVILAAGTGTRIRSVHGEHPKCLIEVDNSTILDHQLNALSMAGIDDVVIVVGYEKEQIIEHVACWLFGLVHRPGVGDDPHDLLALCFRIIEDGQRIVVALRHLVTVGAGHAGRRL